MSTLKLNGTTSGSSIIKAPDSGSTGQTFTMPASTGTLLTTTGSAANLTGVAVAGISSSADATAIEIDSSENVGINKSSGFGSYGGTGIKYTKGDGTLFIGRDGGVPLLINRETSQGDMIAFNASGTSIVKLGTTGGDFKIGTDTGGNTERIRITVNGQVGIGTTPPSASGNSSYKQLFINSGGALVDSGGSGPATMVLNNSYVGSGNNNYATQTQKASRINLSVGRCNIDVAPSVSADAQQTFTSAFQVLYHGESPDMYRGVQIATDSNRSYIGTFRQTTSNSIHMRIHNTNGFIGSIKTNGTATSFNTSSDYRLKENVDYTWDATTRLKQLKPARFNFITDDTKTLDGFMAHEVSSVVPEAISGEKDATETLTNAVVMPNGISVASGITEAEWTTGKADGTYPADSTWTASHTQDVWQSIDQAKLVPLLTKALQEQQTTIEALEARITTLEG
jgi:hypothetical protein